jgi:hypothetical protein
LEAFIASRVGECSWQDADAPDTSGEGVALLPPENPRKWKFEDF